MPLLDKPEIDDRGDRIEALAQTLELPGVTYVSKGYAVFDVRQFRTGDLPGGFNWVDFLRLDDDLRQEIKKKMDDTNRYQVGHWNLDPVPTISQPGVGRVCQCDRCRPKIKSLEDMTRDLLDIPGGIDFIAKRMENAVNVALVGDVQRDGRRVGHPHNALLGMVEYSMKWQIEGAIPDAAELAKKLYATLLANIPGCFWEPARDVFVAAFREGSAVWFAAQLNYYSWPKDEPELPTAA
jgi:hypothetical protein